MKISYAERIKNLQKAYECGVEDAHEVKKHPDEWADLIRKSMTYVYKVDKQARGEHKCNLRKVAKEEVKVR